MTTISLRTSRGFTRRLPSIILFLSYCASFFLLWLFLRTMPFAFSLRIWLGVDIVPVLLAGWIAYRQTLDLTTLFGIVLITIGLIISASGLLINLFGNAMLI